jgi:pyruvate dehydrogenase E2 component (dihydrolipoamide acetyltransferase)
MTTRDRAPWPHILAATLVVALGALLATRSDSRNPASPPHRAARVDAGAVTLRAIRAGSGPSVVLLHGYGESLMSWRGAFDRLARQADIVALDLPGFGLSDKPPTGYSNEAMATAVLGAMDSLHIARAVLVGHSMGGAVALTAALVAPERVAALVLIAPAVSASAWDFQPPESGGGGAADWVRRAIARYETLRPRFTGPHDPAWLAEEPTAAAYSPASDAAYGVALQAVLREFDFNYLTRSRAAQLSLPTLLIWGEFDQVIPRAVGATLVRVLPTARLEIVPRSLHRPQVERPDTVAALISGFLSHLGTQ